MKQLKIEALTMKELFNYQEQITRELKENEDRYNQRYPNSTSEYGTRINDDYNGEGDEYSRLTLLLFKIKEEIDRRRQLNSNVED
jgi:hypothetical protein